MVLIIYMTKILGTGKLLVAILAVAVFLSSCVKFKKVDARKVPVNAQERAKLNVKEGRGMSLKNMVGNKGNTNFEFSTSNPMWRASLETLDFLPLVTVDYSGGIIITDWYSDQQNSNDAIKITLRFLSNEVNVANLKVIIHQKRCNQNNACTTNVIDSKIKKELISSIVKKAAVFEQQAKNKK